MISRCIFLTIMLKCSLNDRAVIANLKRTVLAANFQTKASIVLRGGANNLKSSDLIDLESQLRQLEIECLSEIQSRTKHLIDQLDFEACARIKSSTQQEYVVKRAYIFKSRGIKDENGTLCLPKFKHFDSAPDPNQTQEIDIPEYELSQHLNIQIENDQFKPTEALRLPECEGAEQTHGSLITGREEPTGLHPGPPRQDPAGSGAPGFWRPARTHHALPDGWVVLDAPHAGPAAAAPWFFNVDTGAARRDRPAGGGFEPSLLEEEAGGEGEDPATAGWYVAEGLDATPLCRPTTSLVRGPARPGPAPPRDPPVPKSADCDPCGAGG